MKIEKKYLFLFIMLIELIFVYDMKSVEAATLTATDIETGKDYVFYWEQNNGEYDSGYLKNFEIVDTDNSNSKVAYCIEPYIPETTEPDGYVQATWDAIGLSEEIKQEILLIAYYGYQYPNHQTKEFRAATQALLWKTILNSKYGDEDTNWDVRYTVNYYDETLQKDVEEEFNVSKEREIISDLIKHHYDKPSFSEQNFSALIGEELTITDEMNVLKNYEIYETNGALVTLMENQLKVTPTSEDTVELKFIKKQVYTETYFVYYAEDYQNMITGGNIDPVYFSINLTGLALEEEINDDPEVIQVVNVPNTGLSEVKSKDLSIITLGVGGLGLIIYGSKKKNKTS